MALSPTPDKGGPRAPRRPRLDPRITAVERAEGLQLGADPDHGVVLHGDPHRLRALLELVDGTRSTAQIAHELDVDTGEVAALVQVLADAGLLAPGRGRRLRVRLIGSGLLARDLAESLISASVPVVVCDPGPPAGIYRTRHTTGGEALHAHLAARGHGAGLAAHWQDGTRCPVTVVADDRVEPDRALVETLQRDGRPHLFVRPQPRGVVVGPLVVPGTTSCLRCHDLVRAADPQWPRVLAQLCSQRLSTPITHRTWAIGQILVALRALADGQPSVLHGATLELDRHWAAQSRTWPRHPRCGCVPAYAVA